MQSKYTIPSPAWVRPGDVFPYRTTVGDAHYDGRLEIVSVGEEHTLDGRGVQQVVVEETHSGDMPDLHEDLVFDLLRRTTDHKTRVPGVENINLRAELWRVLAPAKIGVGACYSSRNFCGPFYTHASIKVVRVGHVYSWQGREVQDVEIEGKGYCPQEFQEEAIALLQGPPPTES